MYASRHLNRLSGEKGNTLVSQKRMQRYSIFFIYANILQKNMHFLTILTIFCNTNVANADKRGSVRHSKPQKQLPTFRQVLFTSSFYLNIYTRINIHARIIAANNPHKQRIMQIKIKKQQKSLEMSKKIRIFAADYCEYTNRLWQNDHQNPGMRVKTNL